MKRLALLCVLVGGTLRADELPAQPLRKFQAKDVIPHSPVVSLRFKPDGHTLLVASNGLHAWEINRNRNPQPVAPPARIVALTTNGEFAALGNYTQIRLWDLAKSEEGLTIRTANGVNTLALSADASILAAGNDAHAVEVWETKTGTLLHTLRGHDAYVSASAFSPSGKLLASGSHDRTIRLWDPTTGKIIRVLEGHRDQVSGLVFLPGEKTLVSSSWDRTIRLWDVDTGKEKQLLKGHAHAVLGVAIDRKGKKLASASLDGTAGIWDLSTNKQALRIEVSADGVAAVALSPDGEVLAAGDHAGTTTLWDTRGKRLNRLASPREDGAQPNHQIHSVALSADGSRVVSGHSDTGIRLWDVKTEKLIRRVGRMTDYVWSVQFSPDGKQIASAGRRNGSVHIWDADKGELVKTLPGQKGGISRVLYSRDGKRLIAAGGSFDPSIYVWDVEREKATYRLEGHKDYIDVIALSPDDKTLASASRDGTVRLWDLTTGKETKQLEGGGGPCVTLAFAPDGKTLAAGGSHLGVTFWNLSTGKVRKQLDSGPSSLVHVVYSRDGRTLLMGTQSALVLLDVLTETERCRINEPAQNAMALAFSADGRRIVTGSGYGLITLWDPTGLGEMGRKKQPLAPERLAQHWQDLAGHSDTAYSAIWKLSATADQSLPLFAKHLQPVKSADPKQVERWVAELGSNRFKVRDHAEKSLERLGDLAQAALECGLKNAETLDHRRRIEQLLERVASLSAAPEMLRQLRMVETLEIIGNAEARRLLERLATGDPGAHLTREAKATLSRLAGH
jgi:WD40 repeat protein